MVDTTILNKLSLIYHFLLDNSLIFLIILLLIVIVLDLFYGRNSKSTKKLYYIIISLILIYIGIIYHKPLLNIFDTYISHIFKLTYFPSIIEYVSFILVTIILQIYSIKRNVGFIKHMNYLPFKTNQIPLYQISTENANFYYFVRNFRWIL